MSATPELPGGEILFNAYLLLLLIEYLGLSQLFPPLSATRFSTVLSYGIFATIVSRLGFRVFREFPQSRLLIAFVAFTGVSILYAYVQTFAFQALRSHFDYFGLFVSTVYLLDRPKRVLRWAFVWSVIVLVLVARNVDRLSTAARVGAFRGAYFLGDGNDFGWLMSQLLPLTLLLAMTAGSWLRRLWGLMSAGLCCLGIIGTQSRGATLALAAVGLYFWLKVVRRKAVTALVLVGAVFVVLLFAPSYYLERVSTISSYQEDESAMSRIMVWKAATRMAFGDPLGVGAGCFSAAYGIRYRPESTSLSWAPDRWLSAHSVYFRALGEYGFLGLGLLLSIIVVTFRQNGLTRQFLASRPPGAVPPAWPAFANMSLIGYAVAGTFLGGLTYPHLYLLSGFAVALRRLADHQAAALQAAQATDVAAASPGPATSGAPHGVPNAIRIPTPRIRPAR